MSRLRGFADRWAKRPTLGLLGSAGVGRESLARVIRGAGAPGAPFVVHRAAKFDRVRWNGDVTRANGGALHVRRPEMLPDSDRSAFWGAHDFRPSAAAEVPGQLGAVPANCIFIPSLRDRPADIGAVAEVVLHSVDAQLGRRRSSLRTETRALLQGLTTPENVTSLRNAVIRGALNATGAEVRPEHIDLTSSVPNLRGVREKLRETERREIEAALMDSAWNVTEAARRMKLPRRTLVYRMSRLGLRRRPGSG